ncbi:ribonuclease H-like domain-containing protein [Tanacetum coccineum]
MTLIEAARPVLAGSKLPTTFWAEAVNTACYVQNRVLVVKPHNKTPYELFHGRTPTLSFMRPFGCLVTILNTIDHLGKFDGKADEGFFVGYSLNSKAFRVFNSRTRIVEENLHIRFSESTPNVVGSGPDWLFDIDALTRTMNYEPIVAGTQSNGFVGTKASDNADPKSSHVDGSKASSDDGKKFWSTVKAKTINGEVQLHALVYGKKIIITELNVRRDLQLEDAEGVDCLPNSTIFEQLTLKGSKTNAWNEFNSTMASGLSVWLQIKSGGPRCQETMGDTIAQTRLLDLEKTKTTQANEIASLKRRVKKLEKKNKSKTHKLKRLYKVGLIAGEEPFGDEASLGEDASKQGRINAIDADEEITLVSVQDDADKEILMWML